ncbi:hypothetical protein F2P56_008611 [Juglans regia]|uniref:OTU domain-containing protein n=1 Tax=Juglans regia TaxID=51240 RepID=A0A834D0F6_JUGRE|nr:hypothetical protein F2P56_008611 [Juglans regia]
MAAIVSQPVVNEPSTIELLAVFRGLQMCLPLGIAKLIVEFDSLLIVQELKATHESLTHVPRINGEIPSIDEVTSDHQRLMDRLQMYDFVEHKVQGDGNCQFRALSDQLYSTPDNHQFVRQQVVNQLRSHPEIYGGYVPMEYGDYSEKMSESNEWGDHVTLQAAADSVWFLIIIFLLFELCQILIYLIVRRSHHYLVCSKFIYEGLAAMALT